jgi:hypothetical protein
MKTIKENLILLILLSTVITSCQKDNDSPACGCESNTIGVIDNQVGLLKRDSSNNLFIQIGDPPGATAYYYLCNENLITFNIPTNAVNVVFSGSNTKNCKQDEGSPSNYSYYNIKLTQIRLQ